MKKLVWNYEFPNHRACLCDRFVAKLDNTDVWLTPDIMSYRPMTLGAFQNHIMLLARQFDARVVNVRKFKDIPDENYVSFRLRKHTTNSYSFVRRVNKSEDICTTENDILYADEIFKSE